MMAGRQLNHSPRRWEQIMFSGAGDQKASRATNVELLEREQGGGRRRLNVSVRNLSWNDSEQNYW